MECNICDCEPSTSILPHHSYHINKSLFVLDVVRYFQDHPKYVDGIKEADIVELLNKSEFACGDGVAQVKNVLKELCSSGFVRFIGNGYRTMGSFACLALARTPRQFNIAWDRLREMQKFNSTSMSSSFTSRSYSG